MEFVLVFSFFLGVAHVAIPLIYILWMRHVALSHPWNLRMSSSYSPSVSILLPVYNEQEIILHKLRNIQAVNYPKELLEAIVVDDSSTDNTASIIEDFARRNPKLKLVLLKQEQRKGKVKALNTALQFSSNEVIVTTDADCYWPTNALQTALNYLSDPSVGAVTGTEQLLNPHESSATLSEVVYHRAYDFMRIGESKTGSTIVLNGPLIAYDRRVLDAFEEKSGSDDMDTPLEIVKNGFRCIQIPDAQYFTYAYHTWKTETAGKVRRAQQMIEIWLKCFFDILRGKIELSVFPLLFNVYLHLINPLFGILFYISSVLALIQYPILLLPLVMIVGWSFSRKYLTSFLAHNMFLLLALFNYLVGRKQRIWKTEGIRVPPPEYIVSGRTERSFCDTQSRIPY